MYKFIDPGLINTRAEEWGGMEMVGEIVNMLDESFHSNIPEIEQAVAQRNYQKIKEMVHPLKSNFYYFFDRDTDFGKKIQEFENKGKNQDSTQIEEYLQLFVTNGKITLKELKEFTSQF